MTSGEFAREQMTDADDIARNNEPRLRDQEVFAAARALQLEYATRTLYRPEELREFRRNDDGLKLLNGSVTKEKLRGETVALSGQGIRESHISEDFYEGTIRIEFKDFTPSGDPLEHHLTDPSVEGKFGGFGVRFQPTSEADAFIPVLHYKVAANRVASSAVSIQPFAIGDVGVTKLAFEKDEFQDALDLKVQNVLWFIPDYADDIAKVMKSLAKEPLTTEGVAYCAYKFNEILTEFSDDVHPMLEDALIDLALHYLHRIPTARIKTPGYLVTDENGELNSKTYVPAQKSPHIFTHGVYDAIFMDRYEQTRKGLQRIGTRALYLVIGGDEAVDTTYVPVHSLIEFSQA